MATGSTPMQPAKYNVFRHALTALGWIIGPSASVEEKQRRRIKLLSAYLLLITINTLIGMIATKNAGNSSWPIMLTTTAILAAGYALSRTGYHRLATVLAVSIPAFPIFTMALFSANQAKIPEELPWLALPLLVCSLLLSLRYIIIVAISYITIVVILIPFTNLPIANLSQVLGFMFMIFFFVVAVTIVRKHDQSEIERQLTELQQAEEALRESEEKFSKAFYASPLAIGMVTLEDESFIDANDNIQRISGYTREELIGRRVTDLNVWVNEDERNRVLNTVREQGGIQNEEVEFRKKSGETQIVQFSADIINIGSKPCMITILNDVTECKRSEQALADEAARRRILMEHSRDGIVVLDQDGKVYESNQQFAEMLGYFPEETRKLHVWDWEFLSPREQVLEMLRTVDETGDRFETQHIRKDGTIYDVEISTNGAVFAGEKLIFCVCRDITQRKQAEDELKQALSNLEHSSARLAATNKELEAFSYSVSHDLRAPLRAIDGFSQALLEDYQDKLDEQGKDYLSRLRAASQKMGGLIDGLLKLSRLTRSDMYKEKVDLSALAHEITTRLNETFPERQVEVDISQGLTASGDRQLLRALLENLLSNAWKFTSKCPHAKIEFGATRNGGKKAYFVRDNGAGFDMTYANKLFGAFQRLHDITEYPGTGIGLATVQRIINRHGGSVWAEGAVSKGATFYFTLN
jgi:PAS domain S-box-containing protein